MHSAVDDGCVFSLDRLLCDPVSQHSLKKTPALSSSTDESAALTCGEGGFIGSGTIYMNTDKESEPYVSGGGVGVFDIQYSPLSLDTGGVGAFIPL